MVYKVSIDGTDFRIREPTPFSSKWYSHKHNGPGLRYEVGIALTTGWIVWVHGPFPCGQFSDISVYRLGMRDALSAGESVIADGGYKDSTCEKHPKETDPIHEQYHCVARARHETCNRRFKQSKVLGERFRHDLSRHSSCFHAVVNLTQLSILYGHSFFEV